MNSFSTIVFVSLLATALATMLPARVDNTTSIGMVGDCKPEFAECVIVPVGKCFCKALFYNVLSVNDQQQVEDDCVYLFGSKKAILDFKDPCTDFRKEDRSLNIPLIETLINAIYKKCAPKLLFTACITKH